ncbi:conserved hypothetical protein [Candidatus Desulfarcum epimagneticum]|uniref:Ribbon-helix-helix protein CopG domain-containing protein n=1 Tax=uncultured Desulfobacteraceae bacterium TaxID=218296 RepID=A0A484HNW0_9BACT|nr:conserved hypothetical protein [uncultured Desulfobacteraceae bacterium]
MSYKKGGVDMETTLTIRLSEEMKKSLNDLCQSERKGLSELVRDSLENHLAVKRFRQLRSKSLPFAEASGFLTDEDVFEGLT